MATASCHKIGLQALRLICAAGLFRVSKSSGHVYKLVHANSGLPPSCKDCFSHHQYSPQLTARSLLVCHWCTSQLTAVNSIPIQSHCSSGKVKLVMLLKQHSLYVVMLSAVDQRMLLCRQQKLQHPGFCGFIGHCNHCWGRFVDRCGGCG